jgi:phosphoglycolate phosphatase
MKKGLVFSCQEDERELFDSFLAHYSNNLSNYSRPYGGVPETLDLFNSCGIRLVVCTNKSEALASRLLDSFDILLRFSEVIGEDSTGFHKPDPRLIFYVMKKFNVDRSEIIVVGDSESDYLLARRADVDYRIATFGYCNFDLRTVPRRKRFRSYDELWLSIAPQIRCATPRR